MSTSITVDVLKEYRRLKTKNGQTILGAAIFDDVFAISLFQFSWLLPQKVVQMDQPKVSG